MVLLAIPGAAQFTYQTDDGPILTSAALPITSAFNSLFLQCGVINQDAPKAAQPKPANHMADVAIDNVALSTCP